MIEISNYLLIRVANDKNSGVQKARGKRQEPRGKSKDQYCSLFPVPCSLLPVPCSLFPVPRILWFFKKFAVPKINLLF
ncbi:MAG: hypothetical protein AN482_21705 [Anabaena sp. LE011-02]|jgi:hypothetical protein|nr:MAG: hypothetical protein AN482_21705 [Anabaena sp. LE011-02]